MANLQALQLLAQRELPALAQIDASVRAAESRARASQSRWSPRLFANADAGARAPTYSLMIAYTESMASASRLIGRFLTQATAWQAIAEIRAQMASLEEERNRQVLPRE